MTESTITEPAVTSATDELRVLRERKEALQSAVKIAKAINRLQKGLQAVLLMGNTGAKIPKHAVRFYSELSAEIKHKPAAVLQADLVELDRRVRADFDKILSFARPDPANATATSGLAEQTSFESTGTQRLVDDFRRRAQTAVCLRIALRERGVSSTPFALTVPEDLVRAQLAALEEKERRHKRKIRDNIVAMQVDIEKMLVHPSFPESMKHELHKILGGLRQDIEHIDAGKDIDELPFAVESVVEETNTPTVVTPIPKPKIQPEPEPPPRSFLRRVLDWLNTPWSVTWSQLSKHERDKSK